jgi:hypothetical protein
MRRIDISYGGQWYSIGDRSLEEVHEEIRAGVLAGHHWLQVNEGEGQPRPAYLSITAGVPIAVVPETEPHDPPTESRVDDIDGDYDQPPPPPRWTGPTIHTRRR